MPGGRAEVGEKLVVTIIFILFVFRRAPHRRGFIGATAGPQVEAGNRLANPRVCDIVLT